MSKHYNVLGVDANADEATIGAAFRRAAKTCHPDLNGGDRAGERRLKRLIAARDFLASQRQRISRLNSGTGPLMLRGPADRRSFIFAGALTGAGFLLFLFFLSQQSGSARSEFVSFETRTVEEGEDSPIPDAGSAEVKAIREWRELSSLRAHEGLAQGDSSEPAHAKSAFVRPISKPHSSRFKGALTGAASQVSRTWRKLALRLHGT
jgi:curved DNA-binding protein CbpA